MPSTMRNGLKLKAVSSGFVIVNDRFAHVCTVMIRLVVS